MRYTSFDDMVFNAFQAKRYEPTPRVKDIHHRPRGTRHLPVPAIRFKHRFAIKGGMSSDELHDEYQRLIDA